MIKKEFSIFLIVGSLTVVVDFSTYKFFVWQNLLNMSTAKAVAFVIGTIFAYLVNRLWTFGHITHVTGSIYRFMLLYAVTLATNVLVNHTMYHVLMEWPQRFLWAYLIATATSALLNFIGMKWFVFKSIHRQGNL